MSSAQQLRTVITNVTVDADLAIVSLATEASDVLGVRLHTARALVDVRLEAGMFERDGQLSSRGVWLVRRRLRSVARNFELSNPWPTP